MYGVPVIVRAAQSIRDQGTGIHHGHIVEMGQVFLPQRPHRQKRCDQRLLVPGDMRVPEDRQGFLLGPGRLRGVDLRAGEALFLQDLERTQGGRAHDDRQQSHKIV